jgi:hypothetical protein
LFVELPSTTLLGWLPPGIQIYNEYYISQWPLELSTYEIMQQSVWGVLVRQDDNSAMLLKFYSLFVFIGLVFSDLWFGIDIAMYIYYYADFIMTTVMLIGSFGLRLLLHALYRRG